jgi:hypothetical protein
VIPGTTSVGIFDRNGTRTLTVVKHGIVTNFDIGIVLNSSSRNTIRGVTTSDNGDGMLIGPTSLVKDCIVQGNLQHGIVTGDGVQVEGCLLGGPEGDGNWGGWPHRGSADAGDEEHASGNGSSGTLVGISSTVTYKRAFDTGDEGIAVGQKSLVTHNTANGNEGDGIEACARQR